MNVVVDGSEASVLGREESFTAFIMLRKLQKRREREGERDSLMQK